MASSTGIQLTMSRPPDLQRQARAARTVEHLGTAFAALKTEVTNFSDWLAVRCASRRTPSMSMTRRDILVGAGGIIAASAAAAVSAEPSYKTKTQTTDADGPTSDCRRDPTETSNGDTRTFNAIYRGDYLNETAFPMGGIGAGMICLEGTGALTKFSLRHRPDLASEPKAFSAVSIKGQRKIARVLQGPVPSRKLHPSPP